MKDAAASIEKCGISSANLYDVLKNFELTDVTDKLMKILREAKRDGKSLKAKYPLALDTEAKIISEKKKTYTVKDIKKIRDTILLFYNFIMLVGSGKNYDIKSDSNWQYDLQYYFDGMILDYDDPGNIAYGVIAKATGISDFISHLGAGAANFIDAIFNAAKSDKYKESILKAVKSGDMIDNEELDKVLSTEFSLPYLEALLDDPRDSKMINLGFYYYYKI
jgi:hypothetical protein